MSCHDRKFAGELAEQGALDVLMIRYNAAHPGAEQDIFPLLERAPAGDRQLHRHALELICCAARKDGRGRTHPTAAMCYRFVLSNPHVDVCMTAPRNRKQLEENLAAIHDGPLSDEEMRFMREFGEAVHRASGGSCSAPSLGPLGDQFLGPRSPPRCE